VEVGRWPGKDVGRRVNMVQYCVYMYVNGKMISVETIPGWWEGCICTDTRNLQNIFIAMTF
jgi:hypothetical protein